VEFILGLTAMANGKIAMFLLETQMDDFVRKNVPTNT
jgi:hypothetical protein